MYDNHPLLASVVPKSEDIEPDKSDIETTSGRPCSKLRMSPEQTVPSVQGFDTPDYGPFEWNHYGSQPTMPSPTGAMPLHNSLNDQSYYNGSGNTNGNHNIATNANNTNANNNIANNTNANNNIANNNIATNHYYLQQQTYFIINQPSNHTPSLTAPSAALGTLPSVGNGLTASGPIPVPNLNAAQWYNSDEYGRYPASGPPQTR
jgi:hypothetical protein